MKSSYRKIGDFINRIKVKNVDGKLDLLLGINIDKYFMPSVANIVGTDLTKYKVVKPNQFACNRMHVGRDERLPVALSVVDYDFIVSPAYDVFEIINTDELNPQYLMMWFSRSEFDRNSWFYTDTDVRGKLGWDSLCEMELPIPSIEKQREIIKEYNAVVNRIKLNEQLNKKLEETAQALYKHWFVDFEFPDEEGKPYKSSGGEMVFNEELEKEIPEEWEVDTLNSFKLDVSDGNYSGKYPKSSEFLDKGVPFIRGTDFDGYFISPFDFRYISEEKHSQLLKGHTNRGDVLITTRGASIGNFAYLPDKFIDVNINSQLVRLNGGDNYPQFYLGLMLASRDFYEVLEGAITGSAQPQLSVTNLMAMQLLKPEIKIIKLFCRKYESLHKSYLLRFEEFILLERSKNLLLSKMTKVELEREVA